MRAVSLLCFSAWILSAPAATAEFFVCKPPMSLNLFIDKALENADSEDVILVHPGVIDEQVVIDYAGSNQTALTIVRTAKRPEITGGVVIRNARELVLQGFKVRSALNDGQPAVTVEGGSAVRLIDLRGQWLDDGGIDAIDCFEVTVEKCNFSGMGKWEPNQAGFGVRIRGRCGHVVRDTVTDGNTFRGIWIEAESSEVRGCDAHGNGSGGASAGIYVRGSQNLIKGCSVSGTDGTGILAAGECRVKKNSSKDNQKVGIRYGEDSGSFQGGEISGNDVRDNDAEGILVRPSQSGCAVRGNVVRGNRLSGVRVGGHACMIDDNDVRDTGKGGGDGHGITVESNANLVRQNVFLGNSGAAVFVGGADNYVFENATKGNDAFVDGSKQSNDGRDNATKGKNDFP